MCTYKRMYFCVRAYSLRRVKVNQYVLILWEAMMIVLKIVLIMINIKKSKINTSCFHIIILSLRALGKRRAASAGV